MPRRGSRRAERRGESSLRPVADCANGVATESWGCPMTYGTRLRPAIAGTTARETRAAAVAVVTLSRGLCRTSANFAANCGRPTLSLDVRTSKLYRSLRALHRHWKNNNAFRVSPQREGCDQSSLSNGSSIVRYYQVCRRKKGASRACRQAVSRPKVPLSRFCVFAALYFTCAPSMILVLILTLGRHPMMVQAPSMTCPSFCLCQLRLHLRHGRRSR